MIELEDARDIKLKFESLEKQENDSEIWERIEAIQTTALLSSIRISWKIIGDLSRLSIQWRPPSITDIKTHRL